MYKIIKKTIGSNFLVFDTCLESKTKENELQFF